MLDWIEADLGKGPRVTLDHALRDTLEHLATIRRRPQLLRDAVYRAQATELERVLAGFEWDLTATRPSSCRNLRAVAWNIERGKKWDSIATTLADHPALANADLILLNEVDIGMGRSGNANVAQELASRLGMGYVFCNYEVVLTPGDAFERDHGLHNELGLHGAALLTRLPVTRVGAIGLPEFKDKFHAVEKRLGGKRALFCEVTTATGPMSVVLPHLDPFASPRHRGAQMRRAVRCLDRWNNSNVLLGGDLNTNTYDLGSPMRLLGDVASKLTRVGFEETVRQYMTPGAVFEAPTFEALREADLEIDGFNAPDYGSIVFDIYDPELRDWTDKYLPRPVRMWLERRLRPWDGAVPLRIDWFAGRGITPSDPGVVDRPTDREGGPMSDHSPLHVTLTPDPVRRARPSAY